MAVFAFTDGFLLLNAANLSDHCKNLVLAIDADALDSTGMGATYKSFLGGLKSGQLTIEFMDDFAASSVDVTLFPLLGTVTTFEIRPTSGARSVTNPAYTGSVLIAKHGIGGQLGALAPLSVTYPTSGTVLRQTS
jgi:hypothetical protein